MHSSGRHYCGTAVLQRKRDDALHIASKLLFFLRQNQLIYDDRINDPRLSVRQRACVL